MSLLDRAKAKVAQVRERFGLVDHGLSTQEHYTEVQGNQQAGGITYFGFLSVFPVLALAFFAVGYVARVFPDAQETLIEAIDQVLPGLVGSEPNQIAIEDVESAATTAGVIGLVGVLYAGLGWLSSLRTALTLVFELPDREQPNFVIGKLRDLLTLVVLGAVLMLSVAASGVLTRLSRTVLEWLGMSSDLGWLVTVIGIVVGVAASTLLFFLIFRLLAWSSVPMSALWSGALLGALGFEVLKQLSSLLLGLARGNPAFQAFGTALILLVWINYFSRVIVYAASWAHTAPASRALQEAHEAEELEELVEEVLASVDTGDEPARGRWAAPAAVGGVLGLLAGARYGSRRAR